MAVSNYEIMRNRMRGEFVKYDQQKMLRKFSLKSDADYLYIDFVSRGYRIHRQSGVVEGSRDGFCSVYEADYNESMTIYDVLCYSKDGCALSGNYLPANALKGTVKTSGSGSDIFHGEAEALQGKTAALREACGVLGKPVQLNGDVAAILYPFSFLPVVLQYWEADDEFPANLKFMFDENILDFMHYETIFFMLTHIISRIRETMGL